MTIPEAVSVYALAVLFGSFAGWVVMMFRSMYRRGKKL